MSLSYAVRCDICGEVVNAPLIKTDDPNDQTVYQPEDIVPKEWAVLVIKHRTDETDRKYKGHICPNCAKAIESGESLDIFRMRLAVVEGNPVPDNLVPVDLPEETTGELNTESEIYGVSEEEASQ